MSARNRLVHIQGDDGTQLDMTFFLLSSTDEVPSYYHRPIWSTPSDTAHGTVIYIDKVKGHGFIRDTFRQIESYMTQLVPQWETAIWYRPRLQGRDREVYYRRRSHVADIDH